MDYSTVFRKTDRGMQEVAERTQGLQASLRRALIIIDGSKDVAELSVLMRPGEVEETCTRLLADGFIEPVPAYELDPGRITYIPAADDPQVFADIKAKARYEINENIGPVATILMDEIDACPDALTLRLKLRSIERVLVNFLGASQGEELARALGSELTRLVPRR